MKSIISTLALFVFSAFQTLFAQEVTQGKYWVLDGTIHSYPITMIITEENGSLSGQYYYNKIQEPILFNGSISNGTWNLSVDYDNMKEEFQLQQSKLGLQGKWKSENKVLDVQLKIVLPWEWVSVNYDKQFSEFKESLEGNINVSSRILWSSDNGYLDQELKSLNYNFIISDEENIDNAENIERRTEWLKNPNKELAVRLMTQSLKPSFNNFCGFVTEEIKNGGPFYSGLSQESDVSISYYSENYLVLTHSYSEYTGGAHGLYGSGHITYDLKRKKLADMNDRLTPKQLEKVPELLERHFRDQYEVPEKDKLSEWLFIESFEEYGLVNIYMTDKGVTSYYGLYEIGPYAIGMVEIFIPWDDLN